MLFSSMIFLWVFLPIVLVINYAFNLIVKNHKFKMRLKNTFLLIASLFFYAWGGVYYLSIMICSIIINYVGGYVISKLGDDKNINQKIVLIITVALNLLILGYFKYFNMIVVIIEQMMEHNDFVTFWHNILYMKGTGALGLKEVILPIGI